MGRAAAPGRRTRAALVAGLCLGAPLLPACRCGGPSTAAPAAASSAVYDIPALTEVVWSGGLKPGWRDEGWSERDLKGQGPAKLRMANLGGWMLSKDDVQGDFGGLALRYRAPASFGDFLEVRLDSESDTLWPRVRVDASHVARREDGWVQLFIPFEKLNPKKLPFNRIVLRAITKVGTDWVEWDQVGFTAPGGMTPVAGPDEGAPAAEAAPSSVSGAHVELEEPAYGEGPTPGWKTEGWTERQFKEGVPARVRMGNLGGWSLHNPTPRLDTEGLTLRYHAPAGFGAFLEVRLDTEGEAIFPRVKVSDAYVTERAGEWTQIFVPMTELNPNARAFTQIVIRAHKNVGNDWVEFKDVGFGRLVTDDAAATPEPVRGAPPAPAPPTAQAVPASGRPAPVPTTTPAAGRMLPPPQEMGDPASPSRPPPTRAPGNRVVVDCSTRAHRISPLIYGIAFNSLLELKEHPPVEAGRHRAPLGRQRHLALQLEARQRVEHGQRLLLPQRRARHQPRLHR